MYETLKKNKEILISLLHKIELYQSGKISLPTLIVDTEGLILSIDNLAEDLKDEFYNFWGILEEVYAVNLEKKKKDLSKRDNKLIEQALNNIEVLVNKRIIQLNEQAQM